MQDVLARAAAMGRQAMGEGRKVPVVHSFGQPWFIDFASKVHWWWFMGAERLYPVPPMANVLSWKVGNDRTPSPWLGASSF